VSYGSDPTGRPDIDNRAVRRNIGWLPALIAAMVAIGAVVGLLLALTAAQPCYSCSTD
jgi:hypothetical protein